MGFVDLFQCGFWGGSPWLRVALSLLLGRLNDVVVLVWSGCGASLSRLLVVLTLAGYLVLVLGLAWSPWLRVVGVDVGSDLELGLVFFSCPLTWTPFSTPPSVVCGFRRLVSVWVLGRVSMAPCCFVTSLGSSQ